MAADMLNTGLYRAQLADVQPGDTVVVMGCGPGGPLAIAGARLRGLGGSWPSAPKAGGVELAQFCGATDVLNYKEGDVTRQVYALTHKQGADCLHLRRRRYRGPGPGGGHGPLGGTVGNVNYFTTYGDLP